LPFSEDWASRVHPFVEVELFSQGFGYCRAGHSRSNQERLAFRMLKNIIMLETAG